jgi:hypothetical protein
MRGDHEAATPASSAGRSAKALDPVDRVSETVFGLLMAMSFTGSISLATAGREDIRTMMFAALGCNLAWGLVDAVMFLVRTQVARGRSLAIWRAVRAEAQPAVADAYIADALPERWAARFTPQARAALREHLRSHEPPAGRQRLAAADYAAAAAVFGLVVLATFPVVVPFILADDARRALRVSQAITIGMLFAAGWLLGRHAGFRPLRSGLVMVALGLVMIGGIVLFGG